MLVHELLAVLDLQNFHRLLIDGQPRSVGVIRHLYSNAVVRQAVVHARSQVMSASDTQVNYVLELPEELPNLDKVDVILPNDARYTLIELDILIDKEVRP